MVDPIAIQLEKTPIWRKALFFHFLCCYFDVRPAFFFTVTPVHAHIDEYVCLVNRIGTEIDTL